MIGAWFRDRSTISSSAEKIGCIKEQKNLSGGFGGIPPPLLHA